MSKLYVGNLSSDVDESVLKGLFEEHGVAATSVIVPRNENGTIRGYAFVDCDNQGTAQKAIDKLNGYNLNGQVIVVEHSTSKKAQGQSRNRVKGILIKNLPLSATETDAERLLSTFGGRVVRCEVVSVTSAGKVVKASFDSPDHAQEAVNKLHGNGYAGVDLQVQFDNKESRDSGLGGGGGGGMPYGSRDRNKMNPRSDPGSGTRLYLYPTVDLPVRLLVPSGMVGAIIGKKGANIRQITQQTKARVDIIRSRENASAVEKAIIIYGTPLQCSNTVRKIMDTMNKESAEAVDPASGEIPLKMMAHNSLVGRLIGKGGSTLNKIMDESKTKISISNLQELTIFNMERTISIKGSLEDACKAEEMVSEKLRDSFRADMNSFTQQYNLFPGLNHASVFSGLGSSPGSIFNIAMPSEVTYLYIPINAVGAIIGVKGQEIRDISQRSSAKVRVEPPKSEDDQYRAVYIEGYPDAQWIAQWSIYHKILTEVYNGKGEVSLTSEIMVPVNMVGRIIGKRGSAIQDLELLTRAEIDVPKDVKPNEKNEVVVRIKGHFFASQSAQRQIRFMLYTARAMMQYNQRGGMPGGPGMERGMERGMGRHMNGNRD
ncbi:insulin-like growth factor 2 mRNA-binding protein 1 isoform X1 [Ptychodera flava]|uniref:insulin-like growth factor 2 mRNA-binding protein 1 isoform X1 n=1 Tax=Ptychodera flava TaxID=63121 RepID=UPI00396A3642